MIVLGGGNTAMDCCRSARRLGGESVQVVVRSGFDEMKASPWEKEDAQHEDIPIHNFLVPKFFTHENGKLTGITFEKVKAEYDAKGRRNLVPSGEPDQHFPCDDVLVAVGQENAYPWIERDIGIEFNKWDMPVVDEKTFVSTNPMVFFGGDAAFGPKNIIWAVAHGHDAALSIHRMLSGEDITERPLPHVEIVSQKMGIHEWSYDNDITLDQRYRVPLREKQLALRDIKAEVELGYDVKLALGEAHRCLNCDVQTVFAASLCIECDACVDICPMDCITFTPNGEEADLRQRLEAPSINLTQDLYVQDGLKTGRVMVKDEDVCLHCGLCAERCPTGAWDMQKYLIEMAHAGDEDVRRRAQQRKRFRYSLRQCERLRLGQRERDVRARGDADGRAGVAAQHLPVQHPGLADLVRGARHRGRASRRPRRRRFHGRDESADLRQGRGDDRARRISALRLDQALAAVEIPRGHQRHRRAADRDLQ